jgi:hypothetical protein
MRSRLRFSVRTLAIFVTLLSAYFGALGSDEEVWGASSRRK